MRRLRPRQLASTAWTIAGIKHWQEQFFAAGENALRGRSRDEEAAGDEQIERLKCKVGKPVLDIDILEGGEQGPPFRARGRPTSGAALPPGLPSAASAGCRACPLSGMRATSAARVRRRALGRRPRPSASASSSASTQPSARRKLWALLRYGEGLLVNRKAVYRIFKAKRWFAQQRQVTPRPRVQGRRSVAPASDSRWAIDLTQISCGRGGWGHPATIIDCRRPRDRRPPSSACGAEPARPSVLCQEACLQRCGTLRPERSTPVIRSDSGLVFTARRCRAACCDYHFAEARAAIASWIRRQSKRRPHQALGYLSPHRYRAWQLQAVA